MLGFTVVPPMLIFLGLQSGHHGRHSARVAGVRANAGVSAERLLAIVDGCARSLAEGLAQRINGLLALARVGSAGGFITGDGFISDFC